MILNEVVVIRVYGTNPYDENARSELIRRSDKASVKMSEIQEVRFIGIDINKNGVSYLEKESDGSIPERFRKEAVLKTVEAIKK